MGLLKMQTEIFLIKPNLACFRLLPLARENYGIFTSRKHKYPTSQGASAAFQNHFFTVDKGYAVILASFTYPTSLQDNSNQDQSTQKFSRLESHSFSQSQCSDCWVKLTLKTLSIFENSRPVQYVDFQLVTKESFINCIVHATVCRLPDIQQRMDTVNY